MRPASIYRPTHCKLSAGAKSAAYDCLIVTATNNHRDVTCFSTELYTSCISSIDDGPRDAVRHDQRVAHESGR